MPDRPLTCAIAARPVPIVSYAADSASSCRARPTNGRVVTIGAALDAGGAGSIAGADSRDRTSSPVGRSFGEAASKSHVRRLSHAGTSRTRLSGGTV